jgi:hypothetical protein
MGCGVSFLAGAVPGALIGSAIRRWDNVNVDGHADAVLEAVEAL